MAELALNKSALTVTIPAGQSISNSVNLTLTGSVLVVLSPLAWTPANISFLVSADDVTYCDLYTAEGVEMIKSMGPHRATIVDPAVTAGAIYLKLRSGPVANPVIQTADRVFTLIVQ